MNIEMSSGFKNMGCGTVLILIVFGLLFLPYIFFIVVPVAILMTEMLGNERLAMRIVVPILAGCYFLLVYLIITGLKMVFAKDKKSDNSER